MAFKFPIRDRTDAPTAQSSILILLLKDFQKMINRRKYINFATLVIFAGAVGGCATPPASAPRFQWGQQVEFESIGFEFNSARTTTSFTNWVNQRTQAADTFVIVEVTMVNRTKSPLPMHFQPVFRLTDQSGAIYEPDLQSTMMINMNKPGRLTFGQNMNPNTSIKTELVFSVPNKKYLVQVIVPGSARTGFGGAITSSGPFFLYDISSQL